MWFCGGIFQIVEIHKTSGQKILTPKKLLSYYDENNNNDESETKEKEDHIEGIEYHNKSCFTCF